MTLESENSQQLGLFPTEKVSEKSTCNGVMGVPITFFDLYNKEEYQLSVLNPSDSKDDGYYDEVLIDKYPNFEILGASKLPSGNAFHIKGTSFDMKIEDKNIFKRIFIRNSITSVSTRIYELLKDFAKDTSMQEIMIRVSRIENEEEQRNDD